MSEPARRLEAAVAFFAEVRRNAVVERAPAVAVVHGWYTRHERGGNVTVVSLPGVSRCRDLTPGAWTRMACALLQDYLREGR